MSIELPKDAEGREIPLDSTVLYDRDGFKIDVRTFAYFTHTGHWRVTFVNSTTNHDPSDMYLTPPDSWEKLLEDLGKGEDICDYFEECPAEMYGKSCSDCKKAALKNIASRIRKLRGADE